jgi:hypothetical protein
MAFDLKKNQGFLITIAVIGVVAIIFIVLWRGTAGGLANAVAELESAQSDYDAITTRYRGEPEPALAEEYKARLATTTTRAGELRQAVKDTALPKYDRASFKEAVRRARDEIYSESTNLNVEIPEEIGFAEYLGEKVPEQAELPRLASQLAIVKDVLDVLLSNRVRTISTVERSVDSAATTELIEDVETFGMEGGPAPRLARTAEAAAGKAKAVYSTVPVKFEFVARPGSVYPILAAVRNQPRFYRVRTLRAATEVNAQGELKDPSDIEEDTRIEMVVEHVLLNPPKTEGTDTRK